MLNKDFLELYNIITIHGFNVDNIEYVENLIYSTEKELNIIPNIIMNDNTKETMEVIEYIGKFIEDYKKEFTDQEASGLSDLLVKLITAPGIFDIISSKNNTYNSYIKSFFGRNKDFIENVLGDDRYGIHDKVKIYSIYLFFTNDKLNNGFYQNINIKEELQNSIKHNNNIYFGLLCDEFIQLYGKEFILHNLHNSSLLFNNILINIIMNDLFISNKQSFYKQLELILLQNKDILSDNYIYYDNTDFNKLLSLQFISYKDDVNKKEKNLKGLGFKSQDKLSIIIENSLSERNFNTQEIITYFNMGLFFKLYNYKDISLIEIYNAIKIKYDTSYNEVFLTKVLLYSNIPFDYFLQSSQELSGYIEKYLFKSDLSNKEKIIIDNIIHFYDTFDYFIKNDYDQFKDKYISNELYVLFLKNINNEELFTNFMQKYIFDNYKLTDDILSCYKQIIPLLSKDILINILYYHKIENFNNFNDYKSVISLVFQSLKKYLDKNDYFNLFLQYSIDTIDINNKTLLFNRNEIESEYLSLFSISNRIQYFEDILSRINLETLINPIRFIIFIEDVIYNEYEIKTELYIIILNLLKNSNTQYKDFIINTLILNYVDKITDIQKNINDIDIIMKEYINKANEFNKSKKSSIQSFFSNLIGEKDLESDYNKLKDIFTVMDIKTSITSHQNNLILIEYERLNKKISLLNTFISYVKDTTGINQNISILEMSKKRLELLIGN